MIHMKFIVSSSYLLKQLQVLGSVINSSNTLHILDNFLFELDNNQLKVSSSDLETTMSATLEIESTSQGSIAVPARLLLETLKTFPEQPLTFTVKENNTIEISSDLGKYVLAYAPGRGNFRTDSCTSHHRYGSGMKSHRKKNPGSNSKQYFHGENVQIHSIAY